MGNCLAAPVKSHSPSSTRPSSPGLSKTSGKLSSNSSATSGQSLSSWASSIDEDNPDGRILVTPNLRIFTFTEMRSATRNFKPEMVLGEGGFGKVHKGWLDVKTLNPAKNGGSMVIAVKKLNPESMQGYEEWQSEVNFLGRLSHPNLVKLLGYCWEDKELLLVYEFMSKGSLENHLFRRSSQLLPWSLRMKIVIGAARGLAFLHSSDEQIIYRDFKASNILLDSNYNPKLSDFGLAKYGPSGEDSHVTTRVIGTHGYAAPEYVSTGHLYVKSDVYGFGVVLLEILSGQRALDVNRPNGQYKLVDWAKPYLSDRRKLVLLMDPRFEGEYPSKAAFQAAQLSEKCLAEDPKRRPSMKEVLETLEQIEAMEIRSKEPKAKSLQTKTHNPGQTRVNQRSQLHPRLGNVGPR